jgi:hypothetical protein
MWYDCIPGQENLLVISTHRGRTGRIIAVFHRLRIPACHLVLWPKQCHLLASISGRESLHRANAEAYICMGLDRALIAQRTHSSATYIMPVVALTDSTFLSTHHLQRKSPFQNTHSPPPPLLTTHNPQNNHPTCLPAPRSPSPKTSPP